MKKSTCLLIAFGLFSIAIAVVFVPAVITAVNRLCTTSPYEVRALVATVGLGCGTIGFLLGGVVGLAMEWRMCHGN